MSVARKLKLFASAGAIGGLLVELTRAQLWRWQYHYDEHNVWFEAGRLFSASLLCAVLVSAFGLLSIFILRVLRIIFASK
jgi:hypothetical protein